MLEQSRAYNEQHNITGLLCYSHSGHIVQVIEGTAAAVHGLFAKIQHDSRHHKVVTLSNRAGAMRCFTDWRMAFAQVEPTEFYWLVSRLGAQDQYLGQPQIPVTHPHLRTLLASFSRL